VSTGILGAVLGRYVLDALRVTQWWQRGFALGVAAHGIGTSRAFSVHPEAGAYASLGMGLHGILGAALIPYAVTCLF
jgi:putative effector of murein hydrolase